MKHYGTKEAVVILAITCDCCKTKFENVDEIQEFLCYSDTAGYSSIFGDMNNLALDLCQYCVKTLLGNYLRIDTAAYDSERLLEKLG